jgi:hypothetical protein
VIVFQHGWYKKIRGLMCVQIFYGWDDIEGQEQIIVVEGEIDKLSLEEAGFQNATSVPNGAPAAVKDGPLPIEDHDKLFSYLYNRCLGQPRRPLSGNMLVLVSSLWGPSRTAACPSAYPLSSYPPPSPSGSVLYIVGLMV